MKGTVKKKIRIKKTEDKSKKYVTFSKRPNTLSKKVEELGPLISFNLATVVFSPAAKRLITARNLSVIDQFIGDTSESEIERGFRVQAGKNVDDFDDLNELVEMRSELGRIRESLLQHLDSESMSICN